MSRESSGKDRRKRSRAKKGQKVGGGGGLREALGLGSPARPRLWAPRFGPKDRCLSSQASLPRVPPASCITVDSDHFRCILCRRGCPDPRAWGPVPP